MDLKIPMASWFEGYLDVVIILMYSTPAIFGVFGIPGYLYFSSMIVFYNIFSAAYKFYDMFYGDDENA